MFTWCNSPTCCATVLGVPGSRTLFLRHVHLIQPHLFCGTGWRFSTTSMPVSRVFWIIHSQLSGSQLCKYIIHLENRHTANLEFKLLLTQGRISVSLLNWCIPNLIRGLLAKYALGKLKNRKIFLFLFFLLKKQHTVNLSWKFWWTADFVFSEAFDISVDKAYTHKNECLSSIVPTY